MLNFSSEFLCNPSYLCHYEGHISFALGFKQSSYPATKHNKGHLKIPVYGFIRYSIQLLKLKCSHRL